MSLFLLCSQQGRGKNKRDPGQCTDFELCKNHRVLQAKRDLYRFKREVAHIKVFRAKGLLLLSNLGDQNIGYDKKNREDEQY